MTSKTAFFQEFVRGNEPRKRRGRERIRMQYFTFSSMRWPRCLVVAALQIHTNRHRDADFCEDPDGEDHHPLGRAQ